jgi:hypothetical protein
MFSSHYSELRPALENLDFQAMPTEYFLHSDALEAPPRTIEAAEHRIGLDGLTLVTHLVRLDGNHVDSLGRRLPNIGEYQHDQPEYFLRTDIFTQQKIPADPDQVGKQRLAAFRTVLGSEIFTAIDMATGTHRAIMAEAQARASQDVPNPNWGSTSIGNLRGEVTPAKIRGASSGEVEFYASDPMPAGTYLVADIAVNRESDYWKQQEASHRAAEKEQWRVTYPQMPASTPELKKFLKEKGCIFGHGTEFQTRDLIRDKLNTALALPVSSQIVELNFPMQLRFADPAQLSRMAGRLVGAHSIR